MQLSTRSKVGRSAKVKGKRGERAWCKILNELLPQFAPWCRNLGINGRQEYGDLDAQDQKIYYIEVKTHKTVCFKQIQDWMDEAKYATRRVERMSTLLCVKANGFPPTIFFSLIPTVDMKARAHALGVFLITL